MFRQFYRCRAEAVRMRGGGLEFERRTVPQSGMPGPGAVPHSLRQSDSKREREKKATTGNINNKGPRRVMCGAELRRLAFFPQILSSISPLPARGCMSCGDNLVQSTLQLHDQQSCKL